MLWLDLISVRVVRIVFAGNAINVMLTHDHADNSIVISRSPSVAVAIFAYPYHKCTRDWQRVVKSGFCVVWGVFRGSQRRIQVFSAPTIQSLFIDLLLFQILVCECSSVSGHPAKQ